MKTLYYQVTPEGKESYLKEDGETLTVGEMKEILSRYPDEMPILATWEGIYARVRDDGIEDWKEHHYKWHDLCPCLILDANE